MNQRQVQRWWFWGAVLLTLVKIWLTRGQAVFAIGPAAVDDRLFLRLAESILHGDWLGNYDIYTLVKGPFYSIWVALVAACGVPLRLAEQCAYAGACALLVRALAPLIQAAWARGSLYLLLLCNPMTYEMIVLGRVLRQNIYTPLAITIFAALVALYTHCGLPLRRLLPWAITLGFAGGAFWLTREESIWIAPSVALLLGAALWGAWQHGRGAQLATMGRALGVATICLSLPLLSVCTLNARHYGWFGTVEINSKEFNAAYGALLRLQVGPTYPFTPVSREAREAAYRISPAFAELRPFLEGDIGRSWAGPSQSLTQRPPEERQIAGGWFMWALRDAVAAAGYTHHAREALDFYAQLAREVNAACDSGKIAAGPPRTGMLPPGREGQAQAWAVAFGEFADYFVAFRGFSAHAPASIGNDPSLQLFRRMTRERLSPSPESPGTLAMDNPTPLDSWRTAALQRIGKILRKTLQMLVFAAHAGAVWLAIRQWRRRQFSYCLVLAVAAWGACVACLLINALVHVTSFPTLSTGQFAAAYPLLLLFIGAVAVGLAAEKRTPAS